MIIVSYLVTKLDISKPHFIVIAILFLISSPVVGSYVYTTYMAPVPEVKVPNITWLSVEEAKVKLAKLGLKARIAERAFERKVPEGKIISQRPEAGGLVKIGRLINLKVSIGERLVFAPNLVGRPISQIEIVLSEAGLKMGEKEYEHSEQFQSGVVLRQEPLPDDEVPVGSSVDIVIAENPNFGIVRVPNLVSVALDEAKETLNDLKLNCVVFYHETSQFDEGTVISQEPIGGEELRMGSVVRVFVSILPSVESWSAPEGEE
jgi:serine/threonine-protein kinase